MNTQLRHWRRPCTPRCRTAGLRLGRPSRSWPPPPALCWSFAGAASPRRRYRRRRAVRARPPPRPATITRVITTGGMPGWQITLIALAAALVAATAAVLLDRTLARRRPVSAMTA